MYYIRLDNNLNRTIEKEIYTLYSEGDIFGTLAYMVSKITILRLFLQENNIRSTNTLEFLFLKKPYSAYDYAVYILKERKENLENVIAKDHHFSRQYASFFLQDRFEKGEVVIATNALSSCYYAKYALNSRFYLGEEAIKNSPYKEEYEAHFGIKL